MERIAFLLVLEHAWVGLTELGLVEAVAKTLGGLLHLFVDFLLILGNLVLDEHIGTIALLRVAVVDEGVVEGVDVSAGLPHHGVHEDGGVDADNVVVEQHHGVPPIFLDVVFQFYTVGSVVVHGCQSIGINV